MVTRVLLHLERTFLVHPPEYLSACKIWRRLNIFISQDVWFIQRLFLALYTSLWKILTDFMSNNSPIPATQTQVHSWGFLCLPMKDKYLKKTNRKIWIILPLSFTSKSTKYREIFFITQSNCLYQHLVFANYAVITQLARLIANLRRAKIQSFFSCYNPSLSFDEIMFS